MTHTRFLGFDCVALENRTLELLVTQSVGPRIISLRFNGGDNLFAELPDLTEALPDGDTYHFYGGHRLWHAPEAMPRTYVPDDDPVEISASSDSLVATQLPEALTGIQKSIQISLSGEGPKVIIQHTLTNQGVWPVECAPWSITQLKPGGIAILPQSLQQTGLLPNRSLAMWPYTDMTSPHVQWGNEYVFIHANMYQPFKLGFPNPRGWQAYWLDGTLFVKRMAFNPNAVYSDFNSSSQCFCNHLFLELETLAPLTSLAPRSSTTHIETWELYTVSDFQADEVSTRALVERCNLG